MTFELFDVAATLKENSESLPVLDAERAVFASRKVARQLGPALITRQARERERFSADRAMARCVFDALHLLGGPARHLDHGRAGGRFDVERSLSISYRDFSLSAANAGPIFSFGK